MFQAAAAGQGGCDGAAAGILSSFCHAATSQVFTILRVVSYVTVRYGIKNVANMAHNRVFSTYLSAFSWPAKYFTFVLHVLISDT